MLTLLREKFKNTVSFMDEVDMLLAYWYQIRETLIITLEILDDALLIIKSKAGEAVP